MIWYVAGTVFIAFVLIKFVFSAPRKASKFIGKAINIQPRHIECMFISMGPERGSMIVSQLNSRKDEVLRDAVFTFYIYQIYVKNQHPENIKWWRDKLLRHGYRVRIDKANAELAAMYLRDAGVKFSELLRFAEEYNKNYCT